MLVVSYFPPLRRGPWSTPLPAALLRPSEELPLTPASGELVVDVHAIALSYRHWLAARLYIPSNLLIFLKFLHFLFADRPFYQPSFYSKRVFFRECFHHPKITQSFLWHCVLTDIFLFWIFFRDTPPLFKFSNFKFRVFRSNFSHFSFPVSNSSNLFQPLKNILEAENHRAC